MRKIKPQWTDYKIREEFINGMYENRLSKEFEDKCYELLTSEDLETKMKQVTIDYKISTKVNFTNKMFNPISWLGQATCNLYFKATARETVNGWLSMTKEQQDRANNIAKKVIMEWRSNYENL